jgi:hypothetical protein
MVSSSVWGVTDYFIPIEAGTSARTVRAGHIGGFTGLSNAVFDNPADMAGIGEFSGSIFATTFMEEVFYQNLTAATNVFGGVLGVGYMSAGVSGIAKTAANFNDGATGDLGNYSDWVGVLTGESFGYNNTMMKVAYQFTQNETFSWGVGLTYYTTTIDTVTGSGFNADLGSKMNFYPLVLSVSVRNLIPGLGVNYSNGGKEKLPLQIVYGAEYVLWDDFHFLGQMVASDGTNKKLLKSGALNYTPSFLPLLQLSLGYRETASLKEVKTSITAGVGLDIQGVNFDYAFETSENVFYNAKHYFSIGISF